MSRKLGTHRGQYVARSQLLELARLAADGQTQASIAQRLGISRASVNQALRDPNPHYDGMRRRIIEALSDVRFADDTYLRVE